MWCWCNSASHTAHSPPPPAALPQVAESWQVPGFSIHFLHMPWFNHSSVVLVHLKDSHVVLSVAAFGDSQSLFYSHLVSSSSSGSVRSLTSVQLLYSASLQAWTSTSSAGIGDLGCLLSKCCLKVLGSGICVWTKIETISNIFCHYFIQKWFFCWNQFENDA